MAFPVADALAQRSVPFMFLTGYEEIVIPTRYDDVPRCKKPFNYAAVMVALSRQFAEKRNFLKSPPPTGTTPCRRLPAQQNPPQRRNKAAQPVCAFQYSPRVPRPKFMTHPTFNIRLAWRVVPGNLSAVHQLTAKKMSSCGVISFEAPHPGHMTSSTLATITRGSFDLLEAAKTGMVRRHL
jgi:hypothetical protein